MGAKYEIHSLEDLLSVPIERRAAMFRDLEYGLALYEFAVAAGEGPAKFTGMTWTDDGLHNVTLTDESGAEMLRLGVTDERG